MISDKYNELEKQCKKLQKDLKIRERQIESVNKEKETLQREINKSILLQEKLKDVCREQQKLIKSVGNESSLQIREEEERRKENQEKFQKSLNEINDMLSKNNEENVKLRQDNIEMSQKLLSLTKQCEVREEQMKHIEEKIKIDSQLNQAKLNKMQIEFNMEKEILLQQKEGITNKLLETRTIIKDFRDRETVLQEQLNLYSSKYDTFQNAIQKSNKMFEKYKSEIETMSKNTRRLENELLSWKRKYEKCNATLIDLSTERNDRELNAIRCAKQMEQLQKLLRTLHVERKTLYKVLAENKIECPITQTTVPENAIIPPLIDKNKSDKFETMVKNCEVLKETLSSVQEKMKEIEAEQTTKKQEQIIESGSDVPLSNPDFISLDVNIEK